MKRKRIVVVVAVLGCVGLGAWWYMARGGQLPAVGKDTLDARDAVPALRVSDHTGTTVELARLAQPTFLIFYRGAWCPFCRRELSAIQTRIADFRAAGADVLALSNDTVEKSAALAERLGLDYRLLSDPKLEVIDAFGLRHSSRGGRRQISRPGVYLIVEGRVAWRHLTDDYRIRPSPDRLLEQVAGTGTGTGQSAF